jgi:ADP-heptose:LPS heptosyltransferase
MICPGAGYLYRAWPVENYAKLADKIYQKYNLIGLICGTKAEADLANKIKNFSSAKLINLVGQTSLLELSSLIKKANFLVANESSFIHLASALATQSICILGGGHYGRFMPYKIINPTYYPIPEAVINKMDCFGCNWRCKFTKSKKIAYPCINNIDCEDVFKKLITLIQ